MSPNFVDLLAHLIVVRSQNVVNSKNNTSSSSFLGGLSCCLCGDMDFVIGMDLVTVCMVHLNLMIYVYLSFRGSHNQHIIIC
jgi:hypothetical protein